MGKILLKDLLETNFSLSVKFKNLTSETALNSDLRALAVSNNGCVLELPHKSCAKGHQILLKFLIKSEGAKVGHASEIEIIGKVTETAPIDENVCEVSIVFNQFIKEEWQLLLDFFERKQEFVTNIINKMKSA